MYVVSGANLHGQWFDADLILDTFQPITIKQCDDTDDINTGDIELLHVSWSYNLYQHNNKFFLAGSVHGKKKEFTELFFPTKVMCNNFILCGNDYSLFLFETELHTMWVISLEDLQKAKKINLRTEITSKAKRIKEDDAILKVCISNFNCICLTAAGTVYTGLLPGPIDVPNCADKVCDIQCGYEHYLLLTDKGRVYSWGNGRRLQLGQGDLSNIEAPKEIEALSGIKITKICAGGWHSLALSESGDLYAWGWNDNGQLGIKEIINDEFTVHQTGLNSCIQPILVDIFDKNGDIYNVNIKDIACGNLHSAIILEDYSVWTAGCNKYGQLGLSIKTTQKVNYFQKIYQCSENSLLKCGPWVTILC